VCFGKVASVVALATITVLLTDQLLVAPLAEHVLE
jgi:hypothetical protein